MPRRRPRWPLMQARLDDLAATFGREHLSPDPLEVVLRYTARDDIEIVGFLASALAFGSARGAVKSVESLLARIVPPTGDDARAGARDAGDAVGAGDAGTRAVGASPAAVSSTSPAAAVRAWDSARDVAKLRGWQHRWLGARDASAVLHILGRICREHGSIEAFFAAGDADRRAAPPGLASAPDIGPALASFCDRALALAPPRAPARVAYWFSGPAKGGTAKRLCLFLRWMCRKDGLDPGPWTCVDPARLVVPLDVHVARISRYTGLLRRRSANWLAAQEVTANLRRFDAADPVRYDYAICRLGILGTCPRRRERRKCDGCPLFEVCLL